ncbi:MAG: F0F1 ATP synthase subunit B [Chloroflexota bacterium]|nr:F0F1 ATP synthase subunit B [Chloroflexota bacterium]
MLHSFILADSGVPALLNGLGINGWAFISQLVSFAIVFFVLWRFALPLVIRTIDQRNATIREGVENAEKARRDLEQATRNAEQVMLDARRQAQDTIARAAQAAEKEAARIQEEAQVRAKQVEQQQIANIQQEAARARAELSRLVVNLSINAAGKVISKSVDSKDNRRLVEEFVSSAQTKEQ